MIKVISPSQVFQTKCGNCKAILQYEATDCKFHKEQDFICQVTDITKYIYCPCCGAKLILDRKYYDWG